MGLNVSELLIKQNLSIECFNENNPVSEKISNIQWPGAREWDAFECCNQKLSVWIIIKIRNPFNIVWHWSKLVGSPSHISYINFSSRLRPWLLHLLPCLFNKNDIYVIIYSQFLHTIFICTLGRHDTNVFWYLTFSSQ